MKKSKSAEAQLARINLCCSMARSPLELACREHRGRGPRLSVRGKPQQLFSGAGAGSGARCAYGRRDGTD